MKWLVISHESDYAYTTVKVFNNRSDAEEELLAEFKDNLDRGFPSEARYDPENDIASIKFGNTKFWFEITTIEV